jgi:nickel transport protein
MRRFFLALLACAAVAGPATAHTAWLEPVPAAANVWRLRFGGHAGVLVPAVPAKLKTVEAWDATGRPLTVTRTEDEDGLRLDVSAAPSLIALHYDNGVHARTAAGGPSVEKPMNEVPGAISAVKALKYGKAIVGWSPTATRVLGQAMEVVPLDAAQPRAGRPFRVRVLIDGAPAAGVRLGHGEEGEAGVTDADGVGAFVPAAGANKLWAGKRFAVADDPRFTQLSYEYLMTFDAR